MCVISIGSPTTSVVKSLELYSEMLCLQSLRGTVPYTVALRHVGQTTSSTRKVNLPFNERCSPEQEKIRENVEFLNARQHQQIGIRVHWGVASPLRDVRKYLGQFRRNQMIPNHTE